MTHAEHHGLIDLFALECDAHVRAIRLQLAALQDPASAAHATIDVLDILHTLAGAARAVDLADLEYLCRTLEALALRQDAAWPHVQLALLEEGLALAPLLLVPAARTRNRLMAFAGRCGSGAA